jgi:hypothetical protein
MTEILLQFPTLRMHTSAFLADVHNQSHSTPLSCLDALANSMYEVWSTGTDGRTENV